MLTPLFSAEELERSCLTETPTFSELRRNPVGLVDVGARWGVSEIFAPAAPFFDVLAFEPDPDEVARLRNEAMRKAPWAAVTVDPTALADRRKNVSLHLLRRANNSSLFPVLKHYYERYKLTGFELSQILELRAQSLDDVVFAPRFSHHRFGEIIKIDSQGAELEILGGAERTLRKRTLCIICEAAFFTPYEGACLFSDVERRLRQLGFSFYAFVDVQHRSTKRLDKRTHRGRERLMQADAIFFRDPFDRAKSGKDLLPREAAILVLASTLLGLYDFSLELCDLPLWRGEERDIVTRAIHQLAFVPAESVRETINRLSSLRDADASNALIAVGRLVDKLRDFHTYHEFPEDE